MKRLILILIIILPLLALSAETEREERFKDGVSAYANEKFKKAAKIFQELAAEGSVSWELYYNLGNSYYRQGKLGNAIQYWEKAKFLSPAQEDITYNLSIARRQLADKVVLPEMIPVLRRYNALKDRLPLNHAIRTIGLLLFLFILVQGSCRLYKKLGGRPRKGLCIVSGTILLLLVLLSGYITVDAARDRNENHAVILAGEAKIISEPDNDAPVLFILHEGSKVRINKMIEDVWANISYFDDKEGWIKTKHLGMIEE
ncbi:MAG: tetratricopeptide repeat protein [Candidatus Marinimicrobia bacterium]|nr:tetratricopeptide repeat protein [Candidatus Neomarinimicrobiota bacterium]